MDTVVNITVNTPAPEWALDLLAAVEYYEDVHPKVEAGRDCLGDALAAIPAEVRAEARGWARAKRAAKADPAPTPPAPTFEAGSSLHAERADGPAYADPYAGDVRRPAGFTP